MCPDDGPTAMSADRSRLTMQGPDPVDPSPVLRHILSRAATRSIIATKHKLHACRNLQPHSSPWTRRLFAVLMQIKDTQASWLEAGTKSPGAHAVKFSSWRFFRDAPTHAQAHSNSIWHARKSFHRGPGAMVMSWWRRLTSSGISTRSFGSDIGIIAGYADFGRVRTNKSVVWSTSRQMRSTPAGYSIMIPKRGSMTTRAIASGRISLRPASTSRSTTTPANCILFR